MMVGIAVPTTVASSAPRLMPSSSPAVMACRRLPRIGGPLLAASADMAREAYHALTPTIESQHMAHHTARLFGGLVIVAALVVPARPALGAPSCEALTALTASPGGAPLQVTLARSVAAGAFAPPAGVADGPPAAANPYAAVPAFCRVAATLRPGPKSDVKAEVWMPASGWNGKLQVVGNGGFAGTIGYRALATALANGYAAASTDTGHTGPAANTFVTEDATLDFAYRAIHETAVAAKR